MCFTTQIISLILRDQVSNMTAAVSLTKTLALAMVSHLAITSASFGMENDDLTAAMFTVSPSIKAEVNKDEIIIDMEDIEAQTPLTVSQVLNKKGEEASAEVSKLDALIKYAIIGSGIAAGGALAYFYGPAIAYTVAYKGSLFLASLVIPAPSWYTYNFVIQPAAIDAGVYFATSPLVKTAISASASGLGYVLGKGGCEAYDATKYVTIAAGSAGYSLAKTVVGTTYELGAKAANVAGSTTSSLSEKLGSASSSLVSAGWNWLAGKTLVS